MNTNWLDRTGNRVTCRHVANGIYDLTSTGRALRSRYIAVLVGYSTYKLVWKTGRGHGFDSTLSVRRFFFRSFCRNDQVDGRRLQTGGAGSCSCSYTPSLSVFLWRSNRQIHSKKLVRIHRLVSRVTDDRDDFVTDRKRPSVLSNVLMNHVSKRRCRQHWEKWNGSNNRIHLHTVPDVRNIN